MHKNFCTFLVYATTSSASKKKFVERHAVVTHIQQCELLLPDIGNTSLQQGVYSLRDQWVLLYFDKSVLMSHVFLWTHTMLKGKNLCMIWDITTNHDEF